MNRLLLPSWTRAAARQRWLSTSSPADPGGRRAQKAAYDYYKRKEESSLYFQLFGKRGRRRNPQQFSQEQRNRNTAWYVGAVVVGALGATYAVVPLYKVFCQTTGFGGTTQRVSVNEQTGEATVMTAPPDDWIGQIEAAVQWLWVTVAGGGPTGGARVHTWTDEEAAAKLATLKPVENAELVTIRFDTTTDNTLPWSFVPVQLDVKVVPGETALSFFRVTNHSKRAITGVATYNVHPPKLGLYFQKIQCFCFEEQRLLPGETVDMPVFFFIDPEYLNDHQVSYVRSVTLSYYFHRTDEDDDFDEEEVKKNQRSEDA